MIILLNDTEVSFQNHYATGISVGLTKSFPLGIIQKSEKQRKQQPQQQKIDNNIEHDYRNFGLPCHC